MADEQKDTKPPSSPLPAATTDAVAVATRRQTSPATPSLTPSPDSRQQQQQLQGATPPSAVTARVPSTADDRGDGGGGGDDGDDEGTPSKPRKRRLFFTPSPGRKQQQKQGKSPSNRQSETPPLPPSRPRSTAANRRTPPPPSSTTKIKTTTPSPGVSVGSGGQSQSQSSRPRPTAIMTPPPSNTSLSALSTATPRSRQRSAAARRNRGDGGSGGFNPLSRLSDIFSPQSPNFSDVSPVAPSTAESGTRSQGRGTNEDDGYSSASSDSSASRSVKEPFREQVSTLDELLATPSAQLGDLGQTGNTSDVNQDDSLDTELSNLDSTSQQLAQELSLIDFSLFGKSSLGESGAGQGDPTTPSPNKGNMQAKGTPSGKDGEDWMPLLASEAQLQPQFSPSEADAGKNAASSSPAKTTSGQKPTPPKGRSWGKYYSALRTPPRDKASKPQQSGAAAAVAPVTATKSSAPVVSTMTSSPVVLGAIAGQPTSEPTQQDSDDIVPSPPPPTELPTEESSTPLQIKSPPALPPPRSSQRRDIISPGEAKTPERTGPLPVSSPQSPFNPFHFGSESETSTPARMVDPSDGEDDEGDDSPGNLSDLTASSPTSLRQAGEKEQKPTAGTDATSSAAAAGNLFQSFIPFAERLKEVAEKENPGESDQQQGNERLLSELDAVLTPPDDAMLGQKQSSNDNSNRTFKKSMSAEYSVTSFNTPLHQNKTLPSLVDTSTTQQPTPTSQQIPALADKTTPHSQLSTSMNSPASLTAPVAMAGLLSQGQFPLSDSPGADFDHPDIEEGTVSTLGNADVTMENSAGTSDGLNLISPVSTVSPRGDISEIDTAGPSRVSTRGDISEIDTAGPSLVSPRGDISEVDTTIPSVEKTGTVTKTGPMVIVPIIPDAADEYDIIFDASPQSIVSGVTMHTDHGIASVDKGKASYDPTATPGTEPPKFFSVDSDGAKKQVAETHTKGKFIITFVILICLALVGVAIWAIATAGRDNDVPSAAPTIQPSPSSAPTAGNLPQPSGPPVVLTGAPTVIDSTIAPTISPSMSPTPLDSLAPTPIGAISFTVPYEIFIPNGKVDIVAQDEYIPALIASMDLMTYEIILNVDETGEFVGDMAETFALGGSIENEGNRKMRDLATSVLLPTQISNVVDVDCAPPTSTDLCQRIDSYITLLDGENTWRQFQATTELAIQIGRLQFHLNRVDPDSPAEIMDSRWRPPPTSPPTLSPSSPSDPTRPCSLLDPCSPSASPSSDESSSSQFPSDFPSMSPSSPNTIPPVQSETFSPAVSTLETPSPSQLPVPVALNSSFPSTSSSSFGLFEFLVQNSFDGGLALSDQSSPQYRAYLFLEFDPFLDEYPEWRILQRYALATLYIATNGSTWLENDLWLSNQSECEWYSTARSTDICNLDNELTHLELDSLNLEGDLPPELGLLSSSLEVVSLRGGPEKYLSGSIPSEYGLMTTLRVFSVRGNRIDGLVPSQIGQWENLTRLDLSRNEFLGTIPTTLGNLTALEFLEVSSNFLTGRLPTEMGNLRDVTELLFEENSLLTNIPTELGSLEKLEVMRGGGNVILSLPSELGRMTSARILTLQDGSTAGTIPSEIGQLTDLQLLNLKNNNLSGPIPSDLGSLGSLEELDLSFNSLTGSIPSELGMLTMLTSLNLTSNSLTGTAPEEVLALNISDCC